MNEHKECEWIRVSREDCGCSCRVVCDPRTCICALNGIKCQVDRQSYPCGCSKQGCGNQSGRIEFNLYRVRTHFFYTLLRLQQHRNNSVEPHASLSSSANNSAGGQSSKSITFTEQEGQDGFDGNSSDEEEVTEGQENRCESPDSLEDQDDDKSFEESGGVIGERGECSNYCCLGVASRTTTYPDESHASMLQQYYCANGLGFATPAHQNSGGVPAMTHHSNGGLVYDVNSYQSQSHATSGLDHDCMLAQGSSNTIGQNSYSGSYPSSMHQMCSEDDLINEHEIDSYDEGLLVQNPEQVAMIDNSTKCMPVATHPVEHDLCNDDTIDDVTNENEVDDNDTNEDSDYIVETEDDNFEVNVIDSPDQNNQLMPSPSAYQNASHSYPPTNQQSSNYFSTSGYEASQGMIGSGGSAVSSGDVNYSLPQVMTNYHSGYQTTNSHTGYNMQSQTGQGNNSYMERSEGQTTASSGFYSSESSQSQHTYNAQQCFPGNHGGYHPTAYAQQSPSSSSCFTTIQGQPEQFRASWYQNRSQASNSSESLGCQYHNQTSSDSLSGNAILSNTKHSYAVENTVNSTDHARASYDFGSASYEGSFSQTCESAAPSSSTTNSGNFSEVSSETLESGTKTANELLEHATA